MGRAVTGASRFVSEAPRVLVAGGQGILAPDSPLARPPQLSSSTIFQIDLLFDVNLDIIRLVKAFYSDSVSRCCVWACGDYGRHRA